MVVMSGDAIIAGSRCSSVAMSGSTPPITFAIITVHIIAIATVSPISSLPGYWIMMRIKLSAPRISPQIKATLSSFQITFKASFTLISCRARERITSVLDCAPAFPPVSVSIGINVIRSGIAVSVSSNLPRIPPETISAIISTTSQIIRCPTIRMTGVLRYGASSGVVPAIFWKSSVVSCVRTSIASSTVMIPTSRSSASSTGKVVKLYRSKSLAAFSRSSVV